MKRIALLALTTIAFLTFNASSCQKIDDPQQKEEEKTTDDSNAEATKINKYIRSNIMDVYYYWSDQVKSTNSKVDASSYDVETFFDKMLYSKDRWSWMTDKDSYMQQQTGVYTGTWGVSFSQAAKYYGSYAIRIAYMYPGSPFEQFGVTRGAMLKAINGYDISEPFTQSKLTIFRDEILKTTQTFTFRLVSGRDTTFTTSMAQELSTRSYLAAKVFDGDDFDGLTEKVGYFNYLTFNENMVSDIDSAMALFKREGVKKLILDLRYNGGGSGTASNRLINYLAPASADGKVYVTRMHNNLLASNDFNSEMTIDNNRTKALDLEKVYYIAGPASASASEMVLNGLKPLMDVVHVGDTTYGKPNGMYVFYYPGDDSAYAKYNNGDYSQLKYVYLPICFYNANGKGAFIPDDGMKPDRYVPDDLYHDFDTDEAIINACLTHIVTGQFPDLPLKTQSVIGHGARLLQEYEKNPAYGAYYEKVKR